MSLSVNSGKRIHKITEVIIADYLPPLLSLQEKDVIESEESAQGRVRCADGRLNIVFSLFKHKYHSN